MMKEMEQDPETCSYQEVEESWQPKIIKQEDDDDDGLEMHLNRLEVAAPAAHCTTNGLHPVTGKPSSPEPVLLGGSGVANEEILLVDYRVSPFVRGCRPQLGELPHWCLECGKSFGSKLELETHQAKHAGPNSYICGDCGRSFMEHMALSGQGACAAGHSFSPSGSRRKGPSLPGEAGVQRKERKELSLQEKVRVLEMLEGPKVSQSELAKRFGVSQPQICRIIKNKERILTEWGKNPNPGRKRKLDDRGPASGGGDRAFLQWFEHSCGAPFPTEGKLWHEKIPFGGGEPGVETALPWPNSSPAKPKTGPRRSLPEKWSRELLEEEEDEDENRWESTTLPCILGHYDLPNVYACGETGMLFRAMPEDLATSRRGGEAHDQLTVLLCANMDGSEKKDVWIVGQEARPFGGLRGVSSATYKMNRRAWMTPAIFSEWLQKFNEEMKQQERRVALFITQCGVHPYAELSNVQMVFMPPHLTWLPPLEQGVIQNFKCHYRRRMLTHLLVKDHGQVSSPNGKLSRVISLLDAVHLVVQAWSEVCPQTIANSFKAAGFSVHPRLLTPPLEVVRALGCKDQDQFEQFVLMDEGLECFGDQEGMEPMKEVLPSQEPLPTRAEEEEEKEEPALFPCPSKTDVVDSLAKLRRYLECHTASPNTFQTFYQLEDTIHALALSDMQLVRAKPCQD